VDDTGKPRRAREYLRVSADRSGHMRSTDEQHDDNQRAAVEHGWTLGAPYVEDAAVSASLYSRKPRGDFARLVADLEGARFGATVLVLWEPSRGSRRLSEWARFLELLEDRGVLLHVTSHGRTYDLGNPRDRRSSHEDGVDAEYESGKVSMRVTRAMASNAAGGRPHGRVPYGFVRVYDPQTGQLAKQEPDPVEAPIVREMFQRIAHGESLRQVARDLDARGVRTRSGLVFTSQHIRYLLLRHSYAGLRVHAPGATAVVRNASTVTTQAVWPPLVPLDVWHAVRARLSAPDRRTTRVGRAVNPYSMFTRCDVCSGPLVVVYSRAAEGGEYRCRDRGHVQVSKPDLEAYLDAVIVAYLSDRRQYEQWAARTDHGAELAAVRGDLATARAELDELRDAVGAGTLSVASLARAEPGVLRRVGALELRERELATPPVLAGIISPGRDVKRRWKAAPIAAKREAARLLLSPAILGEVRVTRSPVKGHRVPVEQRVTFLRDDGDRRG
jgi:site-specific DNA recombinase